MCLIEAEQELDEARRDQWLRDLETLDRIERQREEQDPCFFCAMGDVIARRMEGSVG